MRNKLLAVAATAAMGATLTVGTAHADPERFNFIIGTPGPDVLIGTRHSDWIVGRGGNDRLAGRGKADVLRGGYGNDRLFGGRDHRRDVLRGGPGTDYCAKRAEDVVIDCEIIVNIG